MEPRFIEAKATAEKFLRADIERGRVDVKMIPYLERLNNLPFICTLNSCAGHLKDERRIRGNNYNYRDKTFGPHDSPYIYFLTVLEHELLVNLLESYRRQFDNFVWESYKSDITGFIFCIRLSLNGWENILQKFIDELERIQYN